MSAVVGGLKLNGWQRIGIVLSICWAIGAWLQTNLWYAEEKSRIAALLCNPSNDPKPGADCWKRVYEDVGEPQTRDALLIALAPIPLAWLGVWGVVSTIRWIRRGFESQPRR